VFTWPIWWPFGFATLIIVTVYNTLLFRYSDDLERVEEFLWAIPEWGKTVAEHVASVLSPNKLGGSDR
jgi:hypothetical protein